MSKSRAEKSGHSAGTEWIYGLHSATARIARAPESILEAYVDEQRRDARMQKLIAQLEQYGIRCHRVPKRELGKRVDANHQGVLLRVKSVAQQSENALYALLGGLDHSPFLLVLDQVTDPHNLGACLRTADGAGVDAVLLPKDGACPINETVRRVASGAAETMPVFYVTNLSRTLREIQKRGIWIIGLADSAAQSLDEAKLTPPLAIVMGAEGKGMRQLTRKQCDHLISIPMRGAVTSLNVAVAAGVVLYRVIK